MRSRFKGLVLVAAGLCWIAVALGIGLLLFQYVAGGAGLHVFGFFGPSSLTVSIGLAHVVGFAAAGWLSFVIGVGLCAYGFCRPLGRRISNQDVHPD